MPHHCEFGCKATGVVMHVFPNPDKFPERFKSWVNLVGGKLETSSDYDFFKKKRVCDIHFSDEHRNRYKRLNALAIPTLHLPRVPASETEDKGQSNAESRSNTEVNKLNDHTYAMCSSYKKYMKSLGERNDTEHLTLGQQSTDFIDMPKTEDPSILKNKIRNYDDDFSNEDDKQSSLNNDYDVPDATGFDQTYNTRTENSTKIFSWQKPVVEVDSQKEDSDIEECHEGYKCNICDGVIDGMRYACIQCPAFELCVACEQNGQHAEHYVLRVPGDRSHVEVEAVLKRMRLIIEANMAEHEIKIEAEVKEEVSDPLDRNTMASASDTEDADHVLPIAQKCQNYFQGDENRVPSIDEYNEESFAVKEHDTSNSNIDSDTNSDKNTFSSNKTPHQKRHLDTFDIGNNMDIRSKRFKLEKMETQVTKTEMEINTTTEPRIWKYNDIIKIRKLHHTLNKYTHKPDMDNLDNKRIKSPIKTTAQFEPLRISKNLYSSILKNCRNSNVGVKMLPVKLKVLRLKGTQSLT